MDALRGLAAILVVISHAPFLYVGEYSRVDDVRWNQAFYLISSLGGEAVIVFLVLSGYWVGGSVISAFQRGRFHWPDYVTSRLTRLWLVLIPALALTAILDHVGLWMAPEAHVYSGAGDDAVSSELAERSTLLVAVANVLFLQARIVEPFGSNGALWSLSFEAAYYFAFPALLTAVLAKGLWRRAAGLLVVAIVIAVSPAVVAFLGLSWSMGVAANLFARRMAARRWKASGRLQVLAATCTAAAALASPVTGSRWTLVAAVGLSTSALLICVHRDASWPKVLAPTVSAMAWVGRWSYSLYAYHMPVVTLTAALALIIRR